MDKINGSFRDPSGYVFRQNGKIVRTINDCYKRHWECALSSTLLDDLKKRELVPSFKEIAPIDGAWKTLEVEKIPFISYPYEWSFSQLKDAALLTLELHRMAIERGMTLKDATAYNVQFRGSKLARKILVLLRLLQKSPAVQFT